jgi:hypothetical protein
MEQVYLEVKMIEDPSDMEAYTNPVHTYVIVSAGQDVRICHNAGDVMDVCNTFKKYGDPITVEEIINFEDYDGDTLDYIVSCFKGIEADSIPVECEVEWENIDNPDFSCKFTTDLDYGIDME